MFSEEYYKNTMPKLKRYAMALVKGDTSKAEDLVHSAMLKVAEYTMKNPDIVIKNLESFTIRVLKHIFLDGKRRGKDDNDTDIDDIDPTDETLPSDVLLAQKIEEAFTKLKGICRLVFSLQAKGYDYKSTAEKLEKPLNTIKTNISRCRKDLRSELEKLGIGPELKEWFGNV